MAKRLSEMMGGAVGLDSAPGAGSTFWFTARLGVQRGERRVPALAPEDLAGRRLLVVDDNAVARQITEALARSVGLRAASVASGADAIAAVGGAEPDAAYDVVVIDWRMPVLDGLEVARRIRREAAVDRQPKIVVVTAYSREELRERRELQDEVAIDAVLVKPFDAEELVAAILESYGDRAADPAAAATAPADAAPADTAAPAGPAAAPPPSAPPAPRVELPALLSALRDRLADCDSAAGELIDQLRAHAFDEPAAGHFRELARHVEQFDFAAAERALGRLAAAGSPQPTGDA
jgi:CheY-like chemotaxis protein